MCAVSGREGDDPGIEFKLSGMESNGKRRRNSWPTPFNIEKPGKIVSPRSIVYNHPNRLMSNWIPLEREELGMKLI